MSDQIVVPFDETILRLPSCLTVHAQLHSYLSKFTSEDYVKYIQGFSRLYICGILRKTETDTTVIALAIYRYHPSTYDTIRFEIDDIVVDEKERNHGIGTRLFHHLIEQAKQYCVKQILLHCDPMNTNAHRWLFRLGLTMLVFEFYMKNLRVLPGNDQLRVIDITDLPETENEKFLIEAQDIFRQLRPHLPTDQKEYVTQIRNICHTGPTRMIIVVNETNEILGLSVYRVTENIKFGTHIYCDDLVTNEQKRSSGVGRCLINYMKNEGKKLGLNQLILDSGVQRGRAHKFYHREDFIISQFGFSMLI